MTRILAGSVLLAGVALPLAACSASGDPAGSSGSPGSSLTLGREFPKIKAAAQAARSVRIDGHVSQNGQPVSIDMGFAQPGSASGTVGESGASYDLVVTPGKDYVKINKSFLRASHLPAAVCAKACGKYYAVPSGQAASFRGLTMTSLVGGIFSHPPNASESAIKLTKTTFGGQPAWTGSNGTYRVYVARGGTPYLLSLTGKNGESVRFSDWNAVTVSPPPARQVVTAAQL